MITVVVGMKLANLHLKIGGAVLRVEQRICECLLTDSRAPSLPVGVRQLIF
jgi:hypothetical protein